MNLKVKPETDKISLPPFERKFFPKTNVGDKKPAPKRGADQADPFPDEVPLSAEQLEKHDTGASKLNPKNAKTKITQKRMAKKKSRFMERIERSARAELFNDEEPGRIEPDEGVPTYLTRQADICDAVDITSATKHFELDLPRFGPYRINYTRNGRYLLMGGRRGHVAAIDWMTKDLQNETNVMESVRDVQWLHVETMYAVAQKRWLHIYDRNGVELHCIKGMFDVKRLEFLPRHMLLVGASNDTFLHYLDVSIGKMVTSFPTRHGAIDVLTQNPANAIVLTGDSRGRVSMWSPNAKEPLVEMMAHKSMVTGVAVDDSGVYMATTGLDRRLRLWDLRNYKELFAYDSKVDYTRVAFSQRRYVAVAAEGTVQVFNDAHLGTPTTPYMAHKCSGMISDLQFCPYEDVLGVGHSKGFVSLLIPGSGDPHFDALHENPFESKKQRQEREVRMLLDKLQPEMITMDPADINKVNRKGLGNSLEFKSKVLRIKPTKIIDA